MFPFLAGAFLAHITTSKEEKQQETFNPESLGIPYLSPEDEKMYGDNEIAGLGKPVTPNDIYQMITDRMMEMVKEASGRNYKKKWKGKVYGQGYLIPFNFKSKKRYRGVNYFLLTGFEPLENPYYLTLKQIDELGGKLKKGSSGEKVVYFTKLYTLKNKEKDIDFASYNLKKVNAEADKNNIKRDEIKYIPILKYYNVFNGKNVEGIDFNLKDFKIGYINKPLPPSKKMPIPEAIIKHYPNPQPVLRHGGDRAYFSTADFIQMPYMADFETAQDYYRTLFHEYSHSTGVYKRLNRDMTGKFGSKKYAFEELIAEWGATFLSAEAGIIFHTNKNHAEYLKNWNQALTHAKDDNKFIMRACSKAQELTDYVLNRDKNGTPAFYKDLEKVVKEEPEKKPKTIENHKKLTKDELEKANPKPFSKKPKSVAVKTAITDILNLGKFQNIKNMQATVLFNLFKENVSDTLENLTVFQSQVIKNQEGYYFNSGNYFNPHDKDDNYINVELTDTGKELVQSIKNRLESLQNQKNNYALFDGLSGVINISTEKFKDFNKKELRQFLFDYYNTFLKGKTIAIENSLSKVELLSRSGRKITKESATYKAKTAVIEQFEDIIKKSTYNNWGKAKTTDSKDLLGYMNFKSKVVIDGEKRHVRISIEVFKDRRTLLKSYDIGKKKHPSSKESLNKKLSTSPKGVSKDKDTKKTNTNKKLGSVVINLEPSPSTPAVEYKGYATASELNDTTQEPQPQTPPQQQEINNVEQEQETPVLKSLTTKPKSKYVQGATTVKNASKNASYFNLTGDLAEFLGKLERKTKHSVVITLDAPPGSGKTRSVFQMLEMVSNGGYSSLFVSLEEHPTSKLFTDKLNEYISPDNEGKIDTMGELPPTYEEFIAILENYDFVAVDSWNKVFETYNVDFDNDLRKKLNGKLIAAIFQRTQNGQMRGGSKAAFDGDVILEVVKDEDFRNSYIQARKNRYQEIPLNTIGYNFYHKKLINPEHEDEQINSMPATVSI